MMKTSEQIERLIESRLEIEKIVQNLEGDDVRLTAYAIADSCWDALDSLANYDCFVDGQSREVNIEVGLELVKDRICQRFEKLIGEPYIAPVHRIN